MKNITRMSPLRRGLLHIGLSLAAAFTFPTIAAAKTDSYPERSIRLVLGFPPGGSTDIVARIVAAQWSEELKVPIVVDNRPGANATIGTASVATAAPDGYTITLAGLSPLVTAPLLTTTPYDPIDSFSGISSVAFTPEVLAIHPDIPAKNLDELVALSKERRINISSSGNGGLPHLTIEQLRLKTGGNFLHVPYKGASPAVSDTVAGHVDAVVMDLPAVLQFVNSGKLKGIALFHNARHQSMSDVATSVEQGYPEIQAVNWHAILAPALTDEARLDVLQKSLIQSIENKKVQDKLVAAGFVPFTQPSREEFTRYLQEEIKKWDAVIKASNIKIEN
ncbi:tripartite tricarboxylate transporter substrate binding protein [Alcaligenaceae bacterium]|nr:tripartite tricarboxylate transporter substrate binding protein [Alcaligenaceae bacterium]